MKKRAVLKAFTALLAVVGVNVETGAQVFVIDQRSDTFFQPFAPLLSITGADRPPGHQPSQQFRPTLPGLDFVELQIRNDNITVEASFAVVVHEETVTGRVLGMSQTVTILLPPNFTRFDFPSTVPLIPGNLYVLEIMQMGQPRVGWGTPVISNEAYAGGQALFRGQLINADLWFREGVVAPELSIPQAPSSAGVILTARGKVGATYTLQAATELPPISWTDVLTFTMTETVTTIVDSDAANFTTRFYRLKSP
ncbi:MAG: hypothetical protein AB1813_04110 [Verrucomicrobiota bacterium]|jgi:hypothetical protein